MAILYFLLRNVTLYITILQKLVNVTDHKKSGISVEEVT